jgi:drug/metabolite transporter (DMT)-like permease
MEPTRATSDRHPATRRGGSRVTGAAPDGNVSSARSDATDTGPRTEEKQAPPGERGGPGWPAASGLVAVVMWGLAPVATRALVMHLAPLTLLVVRLSAASVVLLPWCWPVLRQRPGWPVLARLLAAGLLGMVGYNLPVTVGLQWVPASTAGLLLASEPVWILLLGRVFLAERVPGRSWAGAAVALGGVAILAGPSALSFRSGSRELAGAALVLLGTLLFGGYTLVLRPLSRAYGALPATAASTVAGSLPYAAFAGLVSPRQLGELPVAGWVELTFLAFGSTAAGMLLWNLAVSRMPASRVSLLLYLEPLVSVVGAVSLLHEHVSATMIIGGALVLAGVGATWAPGRDRRRRARAAAAPGPKSPASLQPSHAEQDPRAAPGTTGSHPS